MCIKCNYNDFYVTVINGRRTGKVCDHSFPPRSANDCKCPDCGGTRWYTYDDKDLGSTRVWCSNLIHNN